MLILPLHKPLTRATFPFATALLIALNVFVFVVLQGDDNAAIARAMAHYMHSGLPAIEVPAYERHLADAGRLDDLQALRSVPEGARGAHVAMATLSDPSFERRLRRGELVSDAAQAAQWTALRAPYDALRDDVFTLRHLLRSSEIDPWRMLSSAFLHGGAMHLTGNMLFLAALGLLVEGALGGWRFLALYLLGALGASAASLAWRWGEAGGGLGASGAVAALMGAFCVLWGRRPVRFFYWFFVVFDYVRKPAIWLLPLWLGWEIFNLIANDDMGIGFDAHAGGLVTGALLGAALVAFGQVREDFLRDAADPAERDTRFEQALAHLGRMRLVEADALLQALQAEQPQRFDVAVARLRVAANAGDPVARDARADHVLQLPAPDAAGVQVQLDAATAPHARISPLLRETLARRWLELEQADAAERLLQEGDVDGVTHPRAAPLWFALGLQRQRRAETAAFQRAMQVVATRFPHSPQAAKARFLLDNT